MNAAEFYNLGNALYDQGRLDEAEAAYRQSIVLDPLDGETWNNLGNTLAELRRAAEAAECFRRAVELLRH